MTLRPEEQLMLELINRARADPEAEAARLGIGLNEGLAPDSIDPDAKQPLAANDLLQRAAEAHSEWMLRTDTFSHEGEGGSSIGERIGETGYEWITAGENIAWEGTTGSLGDLAGRIVSQHESLFLSAGHRQNLLNDDFREAGIAQDLGEFDGYNTSMVTQDFSVREGPALLVGVVIDDRDDDDFYDVGEGIGDVTVTATAGDRSFTTETYAAGGYSLELPAGSYEVVVSGFDGGGEFAETVTVGARNVKLDVELDELTQPVAQSGGIADQPVSPDMLAPSGSGGTIRDPFGGFAGIGGGGRDGAPTLMLAGLSPAGGGAHGPALGDFTGGGPADFQQPWPAGDGGGWSLAQAGNGNGMTGRLHDPWDMSLDRFDFLQDSGPTGGLPEEFGAGGTSGRDAPVHHEQQLERLTGRDASPDFWGGDQSDWWADTLALQAGGDWA